MLQTIQEGSHESITVGSITILGFAITMICKIHANVARGPEFFCFELLGVEVRLNELLWRVLL